MKRKLSPWCKEVKKTLIDRDMSVTELCGEVGMCRNYVTRNARPLWLRKKIETDTLNAPSW